MAPIDIAALRHERQARRAHQMLAHLRSEAYPMYRDAFYPGGTFSAKSDVSIAELEQRIDAAKRKAGYLRKSEASPVHNIGDLLAGPAKKTKSSKS